MDGPEPQTIDESRARAISVWSLVTIVLSIAARIATLGWITILVLGPVLAVFVVLRGLVINAAYRPPGATRFMEGCAYIGSTCWMLGFILIPDSGDEPPVTAVFGLYDDPPTAFYVIGLALLLVGLVLDQVYLARAPKPRDDDN